MHISKYKLFVIFMFIMYTCRPVKESDAPQIKKLKSEVKDEVDRAADAELAKKVSKQNKKFHKNRDLLKDLRPKELKWILEKNKQIVAVGMGEQVLRDACADIMTFGALKRCEKCNGQFVFNKSNYICSGELSEWVKCEATTTTPVRSECKMPSDLVTEYPQLQKNYSVEVRALRYVPPSTPVFKVKKEEETNELVNFCIYNGNW